MAERVNPVDDPRTRPRRAPAVSALRIVFVVVAVGSLIGSYHGMRQHLAAVSVEPVRTVDIWYYALQLFALETPSFLAEPGPYPWLLEVTRFTAPVVTIYAVVETLRVVVTSEMHRRRARWARGHAVVCGDGALAACLTRRLVASGQRVVTVAPGLADGGSGPRLAVSGDARDPAVLRDAGVLHAAAVYACADDTGTNIAVADAMVAVAGEGAAAPAVYVHIADPELCLALQAGHLGSDSAGARRVDFFNVDDLAARNLCAAHPLPASVGRAPTVVIVGANTFAAAVMVELARQWWVQEHADTTRLRVVLVDAAAGRTLDELAQRHSFLPKACDLVACAGDLTDLPADISSTPPERVFICHTDGQRALKTALTTAWLWRGGAGSVLVRQDQLAAGSTAAAGRVDRLLDEVSGAIRLFGVVDAACDPATMRDDLVERLARIIHESYLVARRQRGAVAGSTPALVPWADLPEPFKAANRTQATDIGRKMRLIGCVLAPRVGWGQSHELTAAEVETLARAEHARWLAEREHGGWSYGEQRDDTRRTHPAVRPWDDLAECHRERDRDAMRKLPVILEESGFRIIRG